MKWREFSEKNFKRHEAGGKRFFRKKIFGIRKYKIVSDLSCASRRLGLGGVPYIALNWANLPQIRLYKHPKRAKRCKYMRRTN